MTTSITPARLEETGGTLIAIASSKTLGNPSFLIEGLSPAEQALHIIIAHPAWRRPAAPGASQHAARVLVEGMGRPRPVCPDGVGQVLSDRLRSRARGIHGPGVGVERTVSVRVVNRGHFRKVGPAAARGKPTHMLLVGVGAATQPPLALFEAALAAIPRESGQFHTSPKR